jgi:hypothetical protein
MGRRKSHRPTKALRAVRRDGRRLVVSGLLITVASGCGAAGVDPVGIGASDRTASIETAPASTVRVTCAADTAATALSRIALDVDGQGEVRVEFVSRLALEAETLVAFATITTRRDDSIEVRVTSRDGAGPLELSLTGNGAPKPLRGSTATFDGDQEVAVRLDAASVPEMGEASEISLTGGLIHGEAVDTCVPAAYAKTPDRGPG